jgi:haloalkane dehalogenase
MMTTSQRPDWVDQDLFPFRSRFIDLDGHSLHYVDEGTGPTLLMLHGNPTWSFVYAQVIKDLSTDFRCVALDYPGFGLSRARNGCSYLPEDHAQAVSAFIDALDLKEITLVAQDWGGPIGIAAAEQQPERFSGLVIGNSWAWPVNGDIHFEFFSRLMGGCLGRLLIRRLNLFVNAMIPAGHRRRKPSKAEMAHYRNALPTPVRRQASAVFPHAITHSRDFLTRIESSLGSLASLPTLILWADADIAFREQERKRWEHELPNHTTTILAGVGHYLQSDAPGEFASAIRDWYHES